MYTSRAGGAALRLAPVLLAAACTLSFGARRALADPKPPPCDPVQVGPQGQVATPGLVPGERVVPGRYWLHIADMGAGPDRPAGAKLAWRRYGAFELHGGRRHLFVIRGFGTTRPALLPDDAAVLAFEKPTPDVATVYYENRIADGHWALACVTYIGPLSGSGPGAAAPPPCNALFASPEGQTTSPGITPGELVARGRYWLWMADAGREGRDPGPAAWRRHGPYRLEGGRRHLLRITEFGADNLPGLTTDPAVLLKFSSPAPHRASVYYEVATTDRHWAMVCLQYMGPLEEDADPNVFPAPPCTWVTASPEGQTATPGVTPGERLPPGRYWLWLADAGEEGRNPPPLAWRRFGPYDLEAGKRHLFRITAFADYLPGLLVEPAVLLKFTEPSPDVATTYFEVATTGRHWAAMCLQPVGPAPPPPGAALLGPPFPPGYTEVERTDTPKTLEGGPPWTYVTQRLERALAIEGQYSLVPSNPLAGGPTPGPRGSRAHVCRVDVTVVAPDAETVGRWGRPAGELAPGGQFGTLEYAPGGDCYARTSSGDGGFFAVRLFRVGRQFLHVTVSVTATRDAPYPEGTNSFESDSARLRTAGDAELLLFLRALGRER